MKQVDIWLLDSDDNVIDDQFLLNSLHNSLSGNEHVRENAEIKLPESPTDTQGLDVVAIIQLVLYAGFESTKLIPVIADWLKSHRNPTTSIAVKTDGRIRIVRPDGINERGDVSSATRQAFSGVPDPERSACVLIGISDYANFGRLPGVRKNTEELRRLLGDPGIWGLPEENFYEVSYTQSADVILDKITAAARAATDTLLVYFAGHGVLRDNELRFALPEATDEGIDHTVRWHDIARIIRREECSRKVIWLDCCYAGVAVSERGKVQSDKRDPSELLELAKHEGTYVLAATQRSERAVSRHGSGCTAFTGELVKALSHGVALDPPSEFLSLNSLHQQVSSELNKRRLPKPVRNDPSDIGQYAQFYNKNPRGAPSRPKPLIRLWRNDEGRPWLPTTTALKVLAACAVIAIIAAIALFVPGPSVSGLDLAKYCSTLAPGGTQNFVIADTSCIRPVDLDDACVYSYQAYGLVARFTSPDVNSVQCYNSATSSVSRGGIRDMSGYCASRTGIPEIKATAKNARYMRTWVCESDTNLDAVCDSQNNRADLTSRQEDNGDLTCYKTHWY